MGGAMKRVVLTITCAASVAIATSVAGPAVAQVSQEMRGHVADQLTRMSVRAPGGVEALTDSEIVQIEGILRGGGTDADKHAHITRIVMEEVPCYASPQLRSDTATELRRIGMDASGVDGMSGDEIVHIQLTMHSNISDAEKRRRIERMMSDGAPRLEEAQLRAEVEHCLRRDLQMDAADLRALTPGELSEVNLILSSGGSEDEKRQQIGRFLK